MSSFKTNDLVIALSSSPDAQAQQRVRGMLYTVKQVKYCSNCGAQLINIGGKATGDMMQCGCKVRNSTNGLGWTYSTHFCKLEEADKYLQKAIVEEDYELAAALRDCIQRV